MATQVTVITGEGSTTYSVSTGARGPAGPAGTGGATPAGSDGSVQINNSGALAADSGLVYTGTGNTGVLQTGRGQIAINALPYSGGGTLASNIGIGFNPFIPTSNATLTSNVQGNIGIGDNALDSLSSSTGAGGYSVNNIAIGTGALASLANCQSSIFIGTYAGLNLTADSSSSTIIGDAAGVYYGAAWDNLTQASACTFLGRLTRGSATASTNQIVIGNGAIGDQNNSTVIGNTSTTQTRLAGNTLKLGSATLNTSVVQAATGTSKTITLPNATGTVPVYTAAPSASGKVLTSDGVLGAAVWADPTAGGAVAVGSITGFGTGVATSLAIANNTAGGYSPIDGTATLTNKTLTSPVITNINPNANFTITQNSVAAITSENTGAIANTLYLKQGSVGIGLIAPEKTLHVEGAASAVATAASGIFTVGTPQKSSLYKSRLFFGIDNTTNFSAGQAFIQSRDIQNGANTNILLNPNGGGVAIGATLSDLPLVVGNSVNCFVKITNTSGYGGGGGTTPYSGVVFQVAEPNTSTAIKGGVIFKTTEGGGGYGRGQLRFCLNPTSAGDNVQTTVDASTVMTMDYVAQTVSIGTTTQSAKLSIVATTEQQRIGYDASNYYKTTVSSTGGVTFDATGTGSSFTFADPVIHQSTMRLKSYTVATLPATPTQGDCAYVTDALAPTFMSVIVGGGAVVTRVFYNGTNWTAQ